MQDRDSCHNMRIKFDAEFLHPVNVILYSWSTVFFNRDLTVQLVTNVSLHVYCSLTDVMKCMYVCMYLFN